MIRTRLKMSVLLLTLACGFVTVLPASPAGADTQLRHRTSVVKCENNMPEWPSKSYSAITIYPDFDRQDPDRHHVFVRYYLQTWDPRAERWVATRELERGYETGRTLAPTGWISKGQTNPDSYVVSGGHDVFSVKAGFHRVWTQFVWRSPNSSTWHFGQWHYTATYQNVTYSGDWGFPSTKYGRACDTRPSSDVVVLTPR